jgi:hypothetical protein
MNRRHGIPLQRNRGNYRPRTTAMATKLKWGVEFSRGETHTTARSPMTWTRLSPRPRWYYAHEFWICGLLPCSRYYTRLWVARYTFLSRVLGKGLNTLFSTCLQIYTRIVESDRQESSDTKNDMSCAFGFLATCPKAQPRGTAGGVIGHGGRHTCRV